MADHWHVMTRANHIVTQVRAASLLGAARPPRTDRGPAWKYRTLLTDKHAHLSIAQHSRLDQILATDDELAVVWAIKKFTVQLLATCGP